MSFALWQEEHSELSDQYVQSLYANTLLHIQCVDSFEEKDAMFQKGIVPYFVVIPKGFDKKITNGDKEAVLLYLAPGQWNVTLLQECLSNDILLLRARYLIQSSAQEVGLAPRPPNKNENAPQLVVVDYEGPLLQKQAGLSPPAYGVPSLFWLLAFLHSAAFIPGLDFKRMLMHGQKKLLLSAACSFAPLVVCWSTVLLCYIMGLKQFLGITPEPQLIYSMFGLVYYALAGGALLAFTGKRKLAVTIFVPILFLNMTIGGALWNAHSQELLLPIILPVTAVLSSTKGSWFSGNVLYVLLFTCLLAILITGLKKDDSRERIAQNSKTI